MRPVCGQSGGSVRPVGPVTGITTGLTSRNTSASVTSPFHTRKVDPARQGALGSRFASPHTVRSSLDHPLQSSARFGCVFRCARSEYHRLTAHFIKCRQIPSPQVGRSHNPFVAGSLITSRHCPTAESPRRDIEPEPLQRGRYVARRRRDTSHARPYHMRAGVRRPSNSRT